MLSLSCRTDRARQYFAYSSLKRGGEVVENNGADEFVVLGFEWAVAFVTAPYGAENNEVNRYRPEYTSLKINLNNCMSTTLSQAHSLNERNRNGFINYNGQLPN